MKKVKIGVVGVGRGKSLLENGEYVPNAEFVAICDIWEEGLKEFEEKGGFPGGSWKRICLPMQKTGL